MFENIVRNTFERPRSSGTKSVSSSKKTSMQICVRTWSSEDPDPPKIQREHERRGERPSSRGSTNSSTMEEQEQRGLPPVCLEAVPCNIMEDHGQKGESSPSPTFTAWGERFESSPSPPFTAWEGRCESSPARSSLDSMSSYSCDPELKRSSSLEKAGLSMFEEPQQSGERSPSVEDEDGDIQEADKMPRTTWTSLSLVYSLLKKSRKVKVGPQGEDTKMAARMKKERADLRENLCIEEKRQKDEENERQKVEKKEKERQWTQEEEKKERTEGENQEERRNVGLFSRLNSWWHKTQRNLVGRDYMVALNQEGCLQLESGCYPVEKTQGNAKKKERLRRVKERLTRKWARHHDTAEEGCSTNPCSDVVAAQIEESN